MKLIRTIITDMSAEEIRRFSGSGRPGEILSNREFFQQYGFASRPLDGAEGISLVQGNQIFLIATADRRYKISLEKGEVAIQTDEGDLIHLKRNKEILVSSGNKITINAPVVELGAAAGHLKLMNENMETLFNAHTHYGVSTGSYSTAAPTQQAGVAQKTTNLKAT